MKRVLLFRVDGGNVRGVSMGHLVRAATLAKKLRNLYKIYFISKNYPDGISYIKKCGFEVDVIGVNDDSDETLKKLYAKYLPQKVIIDLFSCPYIDFFEHARSMKIKTIVFDTLGKLEGAADIVINDSLVKDFINYSNPSHWTKLYLGPEYFLIDEPPEIVEIGDSVKEVMITFGGSDPTGLTVNVLQALVKNRITYNVNVVLGPAFSEYNKIYEISKKSNAITIHNNPANFFEMLRQQDVVVCAAGRTLYECAYFGRPVIIVPSIEHESIIAAEYARTTGCFDLEIWNETETPAGIMKSLEVYNHNYSLRKSVFDASRILVDGFGMKRILALISQ